VTRTRPETAAAESAGFTVTVTRGLTVVVMRLFSSVIDTRAGDEEALGAASELGSAGDVRGGTAVAPWLDPSHGSRRMRRSARPYHARFTARRGRGGGASMTEVRVELGIRARYVRARR
jgi:hypothetical protein